MKIKAAVLNEVNSPLVVEKLELMEPRAGEVLVKYTASSPSEKHGWRVLGGMMGPVQ